ncbi:hypothetical protein V494_04007 [Pseudogymnoascus sp. VKM F-4513 (FW-928)]|nr:hypothetical protein V494_04007 [Pseudogymnoascus sp. VKM F-4513 (FW-928)]
MAVGKNKRLSKGKKGIKKRTIDPFTRKDWYQIKAPTSFQIRDVGKTLVNRTTGLKNANDSLKGRIVEVSLADLQKDEDHAFRKIKLRVDEVQGKNCLTNFHGLDFTSDKLRSLVRKWQSLIEANVTVKTTDDYLLRLFAIAFTKRRPNQIKKTTYAASSQIRAIRRKMIEIIQREASSCTLTQLTAKLIPEVIGREIEKATQGIYPLQNVHIRKVKLLKAPKFDLGALLNLHGESNTDEQGQKVEREFKETVLEQGKGLAFGIWRDLHDLSGIWESFKIKEISKTSNCHCIAFRDALVLDLDVATQNSNHMPTYFSENCVECHTKRTTVPSPSQGSGSGFFYLLSSVDILTVNEWLNSYHDGHRQPQGHQAAHDRPFRSREIMLIRYCDDQFDPESSTATIGVDFKVKKLSVRGTSYRLNLLDTAGQERFRTLSNSYYRGAHGVILVYDISNRDSFLSMGRWFEEVQNNSMPGTITYLVGSKLDKGASSRKVSVSEGEALASIHGAQFCEVSSKTRENVRKPFIEIVDTIVSTPGLVEQTQREPNGITLRNAASQVSSGCPC